MIFKQYSVCEILQEPKVIIATLANFALLYVIVTLGYIVEYRLILCANFHATAHQTTLVYYFNTHSLTHRLVFIKECDKRTHYAEQNKIVNIIICICS